MRKGLFVERSRHDEPVTDHQDDGTLPPGIARPSAPRGSGDLLRHGHDVPVRTDLGIPVTAVDLVPSVPKLFHYFHPDAAQVVASPDAHIVVDDGRHYLERNPARYDVIIIDPPPPVEAAGSSMLYSQDFYAVAQERLQPGGILAQWLPPADHAVQASVARALKNSFPYVYVYPSKCNPSGCTFLLVIALFRTAARQNL